MLCAPELRLRGAFFSSDDKCGTTGFSGGLRDCRKPKCRKKGFDSGTHSPACDDRDYSSRELQTKIATYGPAAAKPIGYVDELAEELGQITKKKAITRPN